jgi:hypothetical protein
MGLKSIRVLDRLALVSRLRLQLVPSWDLKILL